MYKGTCENLSNAANSKIKFLESGIGRYFVASALAGIYVGFAALDKFSQVPLYIDFLLKFLYLIVKCRNKKRCDIHHTF
jgi:formate/nitrite transporter FocA (FNT family)